MSTITVSSLRTPARASEKGKGRILKGFAESGELNAKEV